jgi:flagellar biogenesis protein FliO
MKNLSAIMREFKSIGIILIIFSLSSVLCPIPISARNSRDPGIKSKTEKRVNENKTDKGEEKEKSAKLNAVRDQTSKQEDSKDKNGDLYTFEKPSVEEESYAWLIIKTIIVLGALIGGFYYFFRFVTRKAGIQVLGRDVVQVLSIVPLGQNKFLQVVELAGRVLVLGVSENSITLITEVKDRDEIDRIRLQSSKSTPIQPGGFQEYISRHFGRFLKRDRGKRMVRGEGKVSGNIDMDRMDYLRRQRERLKGLNRINEED